jgi:hypothetical protein
MDMKYNVDIIGSSYYIYCNNKKLQEFLYDINNYTFIGEEDYNHIDNMESTDYYIVGNCKNSLNEIIIDSTMIPNDYKHIILNYLRNLYDTY